MNKDKAKVNAAHAVREYMAIYNPSEKVISVRTDIHVDATGHSDIVSGRCVTVDYDGSRIRLYYWYSISKNKVKKVTYLDSM